MYQLELKSVWQTNHLCTRRDPYPAWWTASRCARWGSRPRCRGNGPPSACRTPPRTRAWSSRTRRTPSCQTSPPASPAACSSPDWSASRCCPGPANTRRQCSQILAVEWDENIGTASSIDAYPSAFLCFPDLGKASRQFVRVYTDQLLIFVLKSTS